jgi:heat shock protein HtpX
MSSGIKTVLLLGSLTGLLMLIGGATYGQAGLIFAFVMAAVMNIVSYWFSDKIVLRMYGATEVGPDHLLYRVTARLAQKAGLPMPRVYVIPQSSPNAFVAATEGILQLLPEAELEGVIAHELTHVAHRDILISSVAATIAGAIMLIANMLRFAAFFGGGSRDDRDGANPIALLAMAILAPIAAMLIQAAISRQREFAADRGGARIAGTPTGLASALRHIEAASKQIPLDANPATAHMFIMKPFSGEGLMSLFSSHPPTEARVRALMEMRG